MKSISDKRIAIAVVTLCLLVSAGGLLAGIIDHFSINISADDLAEMKTLVHKYLNERNRMLVCPDPENNPNIADAPIIDSSEMSPELAERQREDVDKIKAIQYPPAFDDFATFLRVLRIHEVGDLIILHVSSITYYHLVPPGPDIDPGFPPCSSEGYDTYYYFVRIKNRWTLIDAKLTNAGSMPPFTEPGVVSQEVGGSRVLKNPPGYIKEIPADIVRLDREATLKIINKWAIDEKTKEAMKSGTYSW
ncbi:MAG: hypothetical protein JW738_03625 [Actinobacteria bacterium]|nr:hypothetical protein [Actinomycetota bacterium]